MAASCVLIFPFWMGTGRTFLAFQKRSHFPLISQIDFKRVVGFFSSSIKIGNILFIVSFSGQITLQFRTERWEEHWDLQNEWNPCKWAVLSLASIVDCLQALHKAPQGLTIHTWCWIISKASTLFDKKRLYSGKSLHDLLLQFQLSVLFYIC